MVVILNCSMTYPLCTLTNAQTLDYVIFIMIPKQMRSLLFEFIIMKDSCIRLFH